MSIETMGSTIAALRKEKKVTQEELADYVGVSAQAVSKWEKGGAPDCALLPSIADFFGVSIDRLFGRKATDYMEVEEVLAKKIMDTPEGERKKLLFSLCWVMERALFGCTPEQNPLKSISTEAGKQFDSVHHNEFGYTLMGIGEMQTYFLLVPERTERSENLLKDMDYPSLFADLSDRAIFDTLVYLTQNPNGKFTASRLVEKLGLSIEKATAVLSVLTKHNLIYSETIEIDGTVHTLYGFMFHTGASFASLLIFAQRLMRQPQAYFFGMDGNAVPYLS